jgi:hypothetical protein
MAQLHMHHITGSILIFAETGEDQPLPPWSFHLFSGNFFKRRLSPVRGELIEHTAST